MVVLKWLAKGFQGPFGYFLLLNLVESYIGAIFTSSVFNVLQCIGVAWAVSWLMSLLAYNKVIFYAEAFFINLIIVVDYGCLYGFGKVVSQDVMEILLGTNLREACEFLQTYLDWSAILMAAGALVIINMAACLLDRFIRSVQTRKTYIATMTLLAIIGFGTWGEMLYSYTLYGNGLSIPQYHPFTRIPYMYHIAHRGCSQSEKLIAMMDTLKVERTGGSPAVVVVIGESYSRRRSQLYGYGKPTSPMLTQMQRQGLLYTFTDMVTPCDHTHSCMHAIFGLGKYDEAIGNHPIFPMLFKKAGFRTENWENQYFTASGISFMSHSLLSEMLWDYRTTSPCGFDHEMTSRIEARESTLYVVHLMGQHYTYAQRFPAEFAFFREEDYPGTDRKRAKIMADYDNATRYNDHVVSSLIDKFKDQDCVLLYFPDHGQVVAETDDYYGHGNAQIARYFHRIVEIPFIVWVSPTYKAMRPEMVERLRKATDLPSNQDDVSHMILQLAGISSPCIIPERSLVSGSYNAETPRILLHSIEYIPEQ